MKRLAIMVGASIAMASDVSFMSPFLSSTFIESSRNVSSVEHGFLGLVARQSCEQGYHSCGDGRCCETGYTCFTAGCCPSGTEPCTSTKCYEPTTEQCCKNGACYKNQKCCTSECCNSIAYCGADGFCKPCPADVRTRVSISTYTSTTTVTSTVTEPVQKENGPGGFSCVPGTVTNVVSASLVLDFDCKLSYVPPPGETATHARRQEDVEAEARGAAHHVTATDVLAPNLLARQLSCAPYTTSTTTLFSTVSTTTRATTTTTTTVAPANEGFQCVDMTATNAYGDELILDHGCSFSYKPGGATTSSSGTGKQSSGTSVRCRLGRASVGLATVLIYYLW